VEKRVYRAELQLKRLHAASFSKNALYKRGYTELDLNPASYVPSVYMS
jgi:hypothetical protein